MGTYERKTKMVGMAVKGVNWHLISLCLKEKMEKPGL